MSIKSPTSGPILSKYRGTVDKLIGNSVGADVFIFPTLADITHESEDLLDTLKFWYDSNYPTNGKEGRLGRNIRVFQAAASTGLFYGYSKTRKTLELYTADKGILAEIPGGDKFRDDFMYRENAQNIIHAMRLDVTYLSVDGDHEVKATSLRGDRKLNLTDTLFVPYISVDRFMKMLNQYMTRGSTMEIVKSSTTGAEAVRYASLNTEDQEYFNGAAVGEKLIDFRYVGKVYVPLLGVPRTTMGFTALRFEGVNYLSPVRKADVRRSLPRAQNDGYSIIRSEVLSRFVTRIFELGDDGEKFKQSLYRFIRRYSETPAPLNGGRVDYIRAVESLSDDAKESLFKKLPQDLKDFAARVEWMFHGYETIPVPDTSEGIRELMKEGLYRVVSLTKQGSFSASYCTNNKDYLELSYGDDYYGRYESETYRVRVMGELYQQTNDIQDAARRTGFTEYVTNDDGTPMDEGTALAEYHGMREAVLTDEDFSNKTNGNVLVRDFFSHEKSSFYRYLVPSRIYSITRLD